MFTKSKIVVLVLAAFMAIGIFTSSASAYCGTAFHNKAQAISFYKSHPAYARGEERHLLKHRKATHYHADQDLITYLEQPNVHYKIAPAGYELSENTSCPSPGVMAPYPGLLNVGGIGMLWYCNIPGDGGHNCVPLNKGYCRNGTAGPPAFPPTTHEPPVKKPPCKCHPCKRHHKCHPPCKCKCRRHKCRKPKPPVTECSNVVNVNGSGNTVNVNQGGNCNEEKKKECECGPPPPPPPPPPPVNHPPQISCTFPPHVYVGESQFMWCEASDSDGDSLTVNIVGDSHLQVSSTIPVNERWDGSPCPSGVHCYRSTLWGKSAGTAHIVAKASAGGEEATPAEGDVEVPEDEF